LFNDGRRTLDDFARRNAIGDVVRKRFDLGHSSRISDANADFPQLLLRNRRRRAAHEVEGTRSFRKRNDIAQRSLTSKNHHETVQAEGDDAMWRCTKLEGLEKESELVARIFFAKAKHFKNSSLQITSMNSDRAATDFRAVQNEIVCLRANTLRMRFENLEVLV